MIEYQDFWDIVYDDREEKKIRKAARKLNSIQIVEVVTYLATEMNRLRDENEQLKKSISHAVIIDATKMN